MKRNLTIFMSCTGIILLLAGARWDLAISDALYAPDHLFAILLQDGWPLIMKLMLALCFALIADRRPAAYIGWGGATLLFAQEASRIFPRPSASVTVLLAMACALFLCLFLRRRLSPAQKARIRPFLIAYLQLLFTVLIITGVLKLLWGRIRYRQRMRRSSVSGTVPVRRLEPLSPADTPAPWPARCSSCSPCCCPAFTHSAICTPSAYAQASSS